MARRLKMCKSKEQTRYQQRLAEADPRMTNQLPLRKFCCARAAANCPNRGTRIRFWDMGHGAEVQVSRFLRRFNVDIEPCSAKVARSEFRTKQIAICRIPSQLNVACGTVRANRPRIPASSRGLHTLEGKYLALVGEGKKEAAAKALRDVTSAFDKAAKTGAVHKATADRKKSRLSLRLKAVK